MSSEPCERCLATGEEMDGSVCQECNGEGEYTKLPYGQDELDEMSIYFDGEPMPMWVPFLAEAAEVPLRWLAREVGSGWIEEGTRPPSDVRLSYEKDVMTDEELIDKYGEYPDW